MRRGLLESIRHTMLPRWRVARTHFSGDYALELRNAIGDASTLLDVGCASHSPIVFSESSLRSRLALTGTRRHLTPVGAPGIHDEYRRMDVCELANVYKPASLRCRDGRDRMESGHR